MTGSFAEISVGIVHPSLCSKTEMRHAGSLVRVLSCASQSGIKKLVFL